MAAALQILDVRLAGKCAYIRIEAGGAKVVIHFAHLVPAL
jgi:hypothetical protein